MAHPTPYCSSLTCSRQGRHITYLLQAEGDEVQHARELGEHDGLGAGVACQHVVQALPQGLDLGAALEGRVAQPGDDGVALGPPGCWRLYMQESVLRLGHLVVQNSGQSLSWAPERPVFHGPEQPGSTKCWSLRVDAALVSSTPWVWQGEGPQRKVWGSNRPLIRGLRPGKGMKNLRFS